jgi:hypothetical protein
MQLMTLVMLFLVGDVGLEGDIVFINHGSSFVVILDVLW